MQVRRAEITKTIVKEMKTQLINVTSSETYQRKIHEDIDVQYLEMKMINGTFNTDVIIQLTEHFTSYLLLLCAPVQDSDITKNKEKILKHLEQEPNNWESLTIFFQCIAKHIELIKNVTQDLQ